MCCMKVQEYLVTFIWLIQQIGQLEQHGSPHILRNTSTKIRLIFAHSKVNIWPLRNNSRRAFEKTGLLIGAMQIFGFFARVSDLAWVDLLDKIKGFLDHHLTTGHFYPDAITDINHDYVFNLGASLTLKIYLLFWRSSRASHWERFESTNCFPMSEFIISS